MSSIISHTLRRWLLRPILILLLLLLAYLALCLGWVQLREHQDARTAAPGSGHFVHAGDAELYLQESGPATGSPVLLVGGTGAWSGTWFGTIPALNRAGYRTIAVDLPPFGYSQKDGTLDFSRTAQAHRLLATMDALHLQRTIVIGHSIGGAPSLELAAIAPTRISKLVLVDAALGLQSAAPDPGSLDCRALNIHLLRNVLIDATAANPIWTAALLRKFISRKQAITPQELAAYKQPLVVRGTTDALGGWAYAFSCLPQGGLTAHADALGKLRLPPVALIWGASDTITPPAQAKSLQALLPGVPLNMLDSVGHIPQIEDPARFESVLLKTLGNRETDAVNLPAESGSTG